MQLPPLPPGDTRVTDFCQRFSQPKGHNAAGRFQSMGNPKDPIGKRTRNFPACSAVSQPIALYSGKRRQVRLSVLQQQHVEILMLNFQGRTKSYAVQCNGVGSCGNTEHLFLNARGDKSGKSVFHTN